VNPRKKMLWIGTGKIMMRIEERRESRWHRDSDWRASSTMRQRRIRRKTSAQIRRPPPPPPHRQIRMPPPGAPASCEPSTPVKQSVAAAHTAHTALIGPVLPPKGPAHRLLTPTGPPSYPRLKMPPQSRSSASRASAAGAAAPPHSAWRCRISS